MGVNKVGFVGTFCHFGRLSAPRIAALALLCVAGCENSSVTLRSGETEFRVPSQYVSTFSDPGLWGLRGGDDNSRSLNLRIPAATEGRPDLIAVLHITSSVEADRRISNNSVVAQNINDATGEFAGGQWYVDAQLNGVRAIPANIDRNAYWYLVSRPPPDISATDVIARCSADTPDRAHWSCRLDTAGEDFLVQFRVPLEEMGDWAAIQDHIVALVESWRISG